MDRRGALLGNGAVLSHRSAAELWSLLDPRPGAVHVSLPGQTGRRPRRGITVHRPTTLLTSHTTVRVGIPVTKPARTLADLRKTASAEDYRRALRKAEYRGLEVGREVSDGTRSELERAMLALCRHYRLPLPEVNVRLGGYVVDFLWREQRLVVETDGWAAHRGRVAFERDRARDLDLKLMGFEVVRFTYRQVTGQPQRVAAAIRRLLVA
jgi:very-short-patch-repair endonuclease